MTDTCKTRRKPDWTGPGSTTSVPPAFHQDSGAKSVTGVEDVSTRNNSLVIGTWGRFHVAFLEAKNTFLALGTLS